MSDDLAVWLCGVLDSDETSGAHWSGWDHVVIDETGAIPRDQRRHLADIAAKRALLEYADTTPDAQCGCRDASAVGETVLRLLASAYADRPGYREEWRPT